MTAIILGQVRFVLVTAFWGMVLMAGYDIWRFLRWLFPHCKFVILAEDIIYWCIMSVPTYIVFYIYNEGEIRWYGVLAIFLGGILYEKGISWHIRQFGYHHLTKPKDQLLHFLPRLWKRLLKQKNKKKKIKNSDCKREENSI